MKELTLFKITALPRVTYRLNAIPIKLPLNLFKGIEQILQKFLWSHKRSSVTKIALRGERLRKRKPYAT